MSPLPSALLRGADLRCRRGNAWQAALLAAGLLLAATATSATAASLRHDEGLWLMLLGQGRIPVRESATSRLRWWFDGQARFLDDSDGFHQSLVRPGIGYAFTDSATAWLGYAWIRTTPLGGDSFHEHRIWQQATWSLRHEDWILASRTRLEQRFVDNSNDTGWRLRQFIKVTHPLPLHPRLGFAAYDEAFLDLNDTDWSADTGFAQNRLFAGLSWHFDPSGRLVAEAGYLNQLLRGGSRGHPMNPILSLHLLLSY